MKKSALYGKVLRREWRKIRIVKYLLHRMNGMLHVQIFIFLRFCGSGFAIDYRKQATYIYIYSRVF